MKYCIVVDVCVFERTYLTQNPEHNITECASGTEKYSFSFQMLSFHSPIHPLAAISFSLFTFSPTLIFFSLLFLFAITVICNIRCNEI